MKSLQIYRSEPDEMVKMCIGEIARDGRDIKEVHLYGGELDYNQIIKDIFESDEVICWW